MKEYDIVVFGGTGYTGIHVIRELFLTSQTEGLSWAIAGRSMEKMRSVLKSVASETGVSSAGRNINRHTVLEAVSYHPQAIPSNRIAGSGEV